MALLIEVVVQDQDGPARVVFESAKACVRMTCSCALGRAGYPCPHKLTVANGEADVWTSSDPEALHEWASSRFRAALEALELVMADVVDRESYLIACEEQLASVRNESPPEDRDEDVQAAEEELREATKELGAAQRKAHQACARIVRSLNGFSAKGAPLEPALSAEAARMATWPTLDVEQLEDLSERLYADLVVRMRQGLPFTMGLQEITSREPEAKVSPVSAPRAPTAPSAAGGCGATLLALTLLPVVAAAMLRALV